MKLYFSLSHKSFPEFADLPKGKAERHFIFAARDFYSSLDGIKAIGLVLLCGALGLLLGLYFGTLAAAAGAGLGIYVGCVLFNAQMKKSICSKLETARVKKSVVDSNVKPAIPASAITPTPRGTQSGRDHPKATISKMSGRRNGTGRSA